MTMRKGEFSRFLLQPKYAYGDMGCPPLVPAAAVILYEVHILDFLDSGQVDDFIAMSPVGKLLVSCCCKVKNPTRHFQATVLMSYKRIFLYILVD